MLLNRSAERTQPLLGRLKKRYPAVTATVVEGDLAEVDGVRAAAMELARVAPRIDLLVNNAGVLTETLQFNKAGVELHFAVNALAPFLLTHLLKRELLQGAPARDIVISG